MRPSGLIHQQSGRLDLRCHLREFELDGLKFADGHAELLGVHPCELRNIIGNLALPQPRRQLAIDIIDNRLQVQRAGHPSSPIETWLELGNKKATHL